jgi:hypothetical protein
MEAREIGGQKQMKIPERQVDDQFLETNLRPRQKLLNLIEISTESTFSTELALPLHF